MIKVTEEDRREDGDFNVKVELPNGDICTLVVPEKSPYHSERYPDEMDGKELFLNFVMGYHYA